MSRTIAKILFALSVPATILAVVILGDGALASVVAGAVAFGCLLPYGAIRARDRGDRLFQAASGAPAAPSGAHQVMTLVMIGAPIALFVVTFAVLYRWGERRRAGSVGAPSPRATILTLVIVIAVAAALDLFVI